MITLDQYWMGRDVTYAQQLTPEIASNATNTALRINLLLAMFEQECNEVRNKVCSGWRPKSVNDNTKNAAKDSNHTRADAGDIEDLDRALATWCVLNPDKLAACGLWMEDPRWTPTWCHFQTVPPGSGKRIYIPSMTPPKAPALPRQKPLPYKLVV